MSDMKTVAVSLRDMLKEGDDDPASVLSLMNKYRIAIDATFEDGQTCLSYACRENKPHIALSLVRARLDGHQL